MTTNSLLTVPLEKLSNQALEELRDQINQRLGPEPAKLAYQDESEFVHWFWNDMANKTENKKLSKLLQALEDSVIVKHKVDVVAYVNFYIYNSVVQFDSLGLDDILHTIEEEINIKEAQTEYQKRYDDTKAYCKKMYDKYKDKIKKEFGAIPKFKLIVQSIADDTI